MKNIIRLELIKTFRYSVFRTIILLHAILFLLVVTIGSQININIQGVAINKLFTFPHVWTTFSWIGSWFNLLLGISVIILVGNEHQFRTFRKQLMDGLSRNQILYSKLFIITILAFYALLIVLLAGFVFGIIFSNNITIGSILEKTPFVLVLFIQSFAYMMLGVLFAFIFKTNALSIVTFILFFFPIEPILRTIFPSGIDKFFPIKIISNLTPMPDFVGITTSDLIQINGSSSVNFQSIGIKAESLSAEMATLVCIGYIIIFYLISKQIVKNRNF